MFGLFQTSQTEGQPYGETSPLEVSVSSLLKSYPDGVWVDDGRLDLVEDQGAAAESSDDEPHGRALAAGKPFHCSRQSWNQRDVLKSI